VSNTDEISLTQDGQMKLRIPWHKDLRSIHKGYLTWEASKRGAGIDSKGGKKSGRNIQIGIVF